LNTTHFGQYDKHASPSIIKRHKLIYIICSVCVWSDRCELPGKSLCWQLTYSQEGRQLFK